MSNGVGVIVAEPQTLSATTVEGGMELTLPLEGTFAPTPTTTCTTQTPTLSDADGRHSTVDTSSIAPTSTTRHNSATNPFAALVPVISAMAGLLATIRRSDPVTQSPPSATHPLYIPLPPSGTPPHRLTPPLAPPAARWLSEEAHRQLLGIPISPGDVITANSDVVIGRPTGLGPRAPPRRPAHILEIRKIPQVYHTDLPPTPLLVNLQPSQIANVLIPHATSAAVVVTTIETTPSLRRDATAEVGRASERHEVLTPPDRLMPPKPPKRPPPAAIRPQQPPAAVRPQQPPAPSPRPPPPLPSSRPAPPRQLPKRPQQPQPPPLPLDVMTPPAPRIDTQTEHNSLFAIRHRPVNVQIPPIRMPPKRFAAASTTTPEVTMRPTWTTPRTTHVEGRTRPTAHVTRPTARSTWPTEKYSRSTDNYSWATDSYAWPTTPSSVATTTAAAATESSAAPGRRTTIQTIFFEARSTEKPKTTQRKTQKPTKIRGVKTTPSPDLKQISTTTSTMWTTPWTTRVHITTPRSIASFAGAAGWGEWQNEPLEVIKNKRIEKPRKPIDTTKYRVEQPNESDLMRHRLEMPEESIEIKMQTIVKPERTAEKKPEKENVEQKRNKIEISKEESPEITRNRLEKLPEYSDIVRVKAESPEESSIEIVKQRIEEKSRKPVESTKHHEEDIEEPQEPTDIVNHWVEKPKKPSIMVTEYQFDKPRQPTEATRDWIEIPIEPLDYTEYKVEPPREEEPLLELPEYGVEILNEEIQHTTAKTTELWPKTTPAIESTRSTMRFETKQSPTRITAATKLPSRRTSTHTPFAFFTTTPKTTMITTTTLSAAPTIHELPANLHEFFFTTTSKRPKQPPKIITKSTFSRTTRPPVKKTTTTSTIDSSTSPEPMSIELVVGTASHARPSVHVVPAAESPPARDEQEPPEVNRVLLGGVLIASPPQPTTQPPPPVVEHQPPICWPACRAHRNEVCQRSGEFAKCACRAGFARMFPDRPCRPTYTYAMAMNLGRFAGSRLFWDAALASNTSARFHHMQAVAHEALHRTAMQSDLRDIYHGLYVSGFEAAPEAGSIQAHFYLQLSDSSDEKRLKDVFGKYLRASNLSLGGTDLFATDTAVEAADFDECRHEALHDCSPHALCFNLKGTYTCSCREGFVDLSENALYPGRQCSAAPIGCAPCNFHGVCIPPGRCECFPWYGGATCRINLKALLIALATLAGVLVCVLVGCVLATGSRIAKRRCGALMVPVVALRTKAGDQRAIVEDNASETSEEAPPPEPQEKEPSLTVMIPRAKYQSRQSVSSVCETKLLSYLDASATASVVSKKEHPPAPPLGALISAGFEVSATVGDPQAATAANDSDWFDPRHEGYCRTVSEARSYDETTIQPSTKSIRSAHEANTMAERDGGSTFLLPHTHLYRPDKVKSSPTTTSIIP
ncbi:mucin-2 isoform X3 [Lutzomyia longipalpis]|uniref:mucin-2 isoform X3 n=1 Tax=Lutzomyia longipalpis TaxID=7200 RepID=UPI00248377A4|nr:mucin-2 isoform X3 [Lutzomyia longipalpis]XP_055690319.1 mucin-2 isoform X3 [Lutzomyia longipalpis]